MGPYPDEYKLFSHIDTLYAFLHGDRVFPSILEVQPTMKCNLNCDYCYTRIGNSQSLSDAQMVKLAESLGFKTTKAVILSGGGEPLLHSCVPDFVVMCPTPIALITNGVLLERLSDAELRKLEWVSLSLHGLSQEEFKHNTSSDQFHKVLHNLELLWLPRHTGTVTYFMDAGVEYNYGMVATLVKGLLREIPDKSVFRFKGSPKHVRAMVPWFEGNPRVITNTPSFSNTDEVAGEKREIYDFCIGKYLIPALASDGVIYCSCTGTPSKQGAMTKDFAESIAAITEGFKVDKSCIDHALQQECYPYKYNKAMVQSSKDIWI